MLVRDLARLLLEARYYNKQWLILQKLCVVLLTQAFIKENQVNLGVTKEILSKEWQKSAPQYKHQIIPSF